MNRVGLPSFIDDVGRVVSSTDDEHEITSRVAKWPATGEARWFVSGWDSPE